VVNGEMATTSSMDFNTVITSLSWVKCFVFSGGEEAQSAKINALRGK